LINEIIQETKERMDKSLKALEKDMTRVRTGRASASMLDSVKVEYYGTLTPLSQMAFTSAFGRSQFSVENA